MHRTKRLRPVALLLSAVTLSIATSACSGGAGSRDYATPKHLCGIPVRPSLLNPLLPGGSRVEAVRVDTGVIGQRRCNVTVDGKKVLSLESQWRSPGTELTDVSAGGWQIDVREHTAKDRSHSYSQEGGASKVTCPYPAKEWRSTEGQLFVTMYTLNPVPAQDRDMEALLVDYARATGKSSDCNTPASGA